jgi:hypothetical protein
MGLILVLEVHNIIIHSLCKYIKYSNLSMYKFKPLFLWHVSMLYTFSCTNNHTPQKLYNTKFVIANVIEIIKNNRIFNSVRDQKL